MWLSSTVTKASHDDASGIWNVTVKTRNSGADSKTETERVFKVKHFVFATGLLGGEPYIPTIPDIDVFKGKALHSLAHKRALDYEGKKVVVIGSCTSGMYTFPIFIHRYKFLTIAYSP